MPVKSNKKTAVKKASKVASVKKEESVLISKKYTNMFQAYKAFWKRGFTEWKGTSSRSEFWWSMLINVVILFVGIVFCFWALGIDVDYVAHPVAFALGFGFVALFSLAIFIPCLSLAIRRFHDFGQPGWLYLILWVGGILFSYCEPLFWVSDLFSLVALVLAILPTKIENNPYHKFNK